MGSLAVHCQGVYKAYDTGGQPVIALRGVDLDIHTGRLMMLVGPSGCGKTTLISVIAGILNQDSGVCEVFGQDLLHLRQKDLLQFRARNIGFVFQAYNLLPTLTAVENASIPLIINGFGRAEANRRAAEMLQRVGLGERLGSFPAQLSGGQQQRVAIARALAMEPELLLFDEPTSALDPETIGEVLNVMKVLAEEGRTMIVVTHEMTFAKRVADWVVVFERGAVVEQGPPEQIFDNPQTQRTREFLSHLGWNG